MTSFTELYFIFKAHLWHTAMLRGTACADVPGCDPNGRCAEHGALGWPWRRQPLQPVPLAWTMHVFAVLHKERLAKGVHTEVRPTATATERALAVSPDIALLEQSAEQAEMSRL